MSSILLLALTALSFVEALAATRTTRCGSEFSLTCKGSVFGSCCSQYGYCGSTAAYCSTGCQQGYGDCNSTLSSSSLIAPVKRRETSKDGTCGGKNGFTCLGSPFGNCCSRYGWCGTSNAYCGTGCSTTFGACLNSNTPVPSSLTTSNSPLNVVSSLSLPESTPISSQEAPSNTCFENINGATGGTTCSRSKSGDCCSQYSYCGSTEDYCGVESQTGFGNSKSNLMAYPSSAVLLTVPSSSSIHTVLTNETLSSKPTSLTIPMSSYSSESSRSSVSSLGSSSTLSTSMKSASIFSTETPSSTAISIAVADGSTCYPTSKNAVKNPSFESGVLDPWTGSASGSWFERDVRQGQSHDGKYAYYGTTNSLGPATITITQTAILVPAGTVVECSAWASARRNPTYKTRFEIFLDEKSCGSLTLESSNWVNFGSEITVEGDEHILSIVVVSSGSDGASVAFGVDDARVLPISGPGAGAACPHSEDDDSSAELLTTWSDSLTTTPP